MSIQVMGTAHCAADPVIKTLHQGKVIADVPVYIKECWTDFQTGESREVTNYFHCVFWGNNAKRAEQLLMKGSQVIITSAKLRTLKDPIKKVTHTQIWVEKWEVPTKVMLSKSVYQEIFQSELMPYKVCVYRKTGTFDLVEVHVDKHAMASKLPDYFNQDRLIDLQFKQGDKIHSKCSLARSHQKFSNTFCDIYQCSLDLDLSQVPLSHIHTQLFMGKTRAYEHVFPFQECLQQEIKND